ncbi:CHAP domain-containing protein [Actinomadura graeca]|uniref:CHAP domain-containing protein n=1 Tax=Actinomadura graeca TaxID=2750812 RepID=A0ABX8R3D4_9ACTN|nr:CHAP domain-containing protein [Actinomadura graeca]QXJ24472.1 CHAP domain-containing protein [Actinomadura graeca]
MRVPGKSPNSIFALGRSSPLPAGSLGRLRVPLMPPTLLVVLFVMAVDMLLPTRALAAGGETVLCQSGSYSCLSGTGYSGQSVWGSWGPGHNCVSYTAYRLSANGASKPWAGAIGNASDWDEKARGAGVTVDANPVVGSIAQWDGGYGHVAYVEVVTSAYIEISEDSYITDAYGYSSRRRIERSAAKFASAEFIHVRDSPTETQQQLPGQAGAISALQHGSRVSLRWERTRPTTR